MYRNKSTETSKEILLAGDLGVGEAEGSIHPLEVYKQYIICRDHLGFASMHAIIFLSRFFVSRRKRCKDFSANTAQRPATTGT